MAAPKIDEWNPNDGIMPDPATVEEPTETPAEEEKLTQEVHSLSHFMTVDHI